MVPNVRHITLDLAFMLCGYGEAELPERLLAAVRLHLFDLTFVKGEEPAS